MTVFPLHMHLSGAEFHLAQGRALVSASAIGKRVLRSLAVGQAEELLVCFEIYCGVSGKKCVQPGLQLLRAVGARVSLLQPTT